MMRSMPRRLLLTTLLVAATACGGAQVGGQSLFNGGKQTPGNFDFANPSSSAAAAIGTQGAAPTATGHAAAPTALVTARATPRPVATAGPTTFQIAIYSDTAAQNGFQPPSANVYQGTVIVFTNRDSKPRSVVSDSGDPASFDSGMIAPGATWSYTAATLGDFNYHDGTRQYTVGSFKVIHR